MRAKSEAHLSSSRQDHPDLQVHLFRGRRDRVRRGPEWLQALGQKRDKWLLQRVTWIIRNEIPQQKPRTRAVHGRQTANTTWCSSTNRCSTNTNEQTNTTHSRSSLNQNHRHTQILIIHGHKRELCGNSGTNATKRTVVKLKPEKYLVVSGAIWVVDRVEALITRPNHAPPVQDRRFRHHAANVESLKTNWYKYKPKTKPNEQVACTFLVRRRPEKIAKIDTPANN